MMNLVVNGMVKDNEGREFTRLLGGFGEDKPCISIKQVAELTGLEVRVVNQTINRNKAEFIKEEGYLIDLKEVTEKDSNEKEVTQIDDNLEILKSLGYSKMAIAKAKNIYILSHAGFLLYLKFAESDKAMSLYKNFIEDYFKTKAENNVLKITLKEEIENLKKDKALYLGMYFMEQDPDKKVNFINKSEELGSRIVELEKRLTREMTIKEYKSFIDKYKTFLDNEGCCNFENAAKIFSTQADSENIKISMTKSSLPKLLRDKGILSKAKAGKGYKNLPNKNYEQYFNTTPIDVDVETKEGKKYKISKTQTRINRKGLDFIYDLITHDIA